MPRREKFFDSELIARLTRMELTARRIVDGFLAGKNRSSRHGFSVEFVEHREYSPGDDLRHLDWKVLGRMDRYYIKRYEEETNITALLLLDSSASMTYRSGEVSKFEIAATAATALAYLLNRQRDAVGLALFDSELRAYLPPSVKGASLVNLIAKLRGAEPRGKSAFDEVVQRAALELPRRSMVIALSDFFVPLEEIEHGLNSLYYQGHEAILLQTLDDAERAFPFSNNILFRGLEDRRQVHVEPRRLRQRYLEIFGQFLADLKRLSERCAFDYQLLSTADPIGPALASLLAERGQRQRIVRRGRGS